MVVRKVVLVALIIEIPLRRMEVMVVVVNIGRMWHSAVNRPRREVHRWVSAGAARKLGMHLML